MTPIDRLLAKCREVDGCWVHRSPRKDGYAGVTIDKVSHYAHRVSYEHFRADIPDGLYLDHLCRNRACVNPWHLEPVTPGVNTRRAWNAQKTHCKWGHPFDEENTYRHNGHRACMRCIVERNRRYRAERKQFHSSRPITAPSWGWQQEEDDD